MDQGLINHALVRVDADYDSYAGLKTAYFVNEQFGVSVFGTVVEPPSLLYFHRPPKNLKNVSQKQLEATQDRVRRSCLFDTKVEIKKGDRVLLNYTVHLENEDITVGENLLVQYDMLYAAFRGDKTIMLNGFILAEQMEYKSNALHGMKVSRDSDIEPGIARIIHIGSPVGYQQHYKSTDRDKKLSIGDEVLFHPGASVRCEWSLFNTLNPTGNHLIRIQRKDIFAKLAEKR